MNAFFRMYLNGEDYWREYLSGEQIPESASYDKIYTQYKAKKEARQTIDNFQNSFCKR